MKGQIPWSRVLVEGVVIVLSILLAFGIEAGWESRLSCILDPQSFQTSGQLGDGVQATSALSRTTTGHVRP